MNHWMIDRDAILLPSWREAFPLARGLRPHEATRPLSGQPGILWCRRRAGEAADAVLPKLTLGPGQFVVVLADEPSEAVVTESLEQGASGCCNTHAAPEVLRQVALVVENGGLWIGQAMLQRLVGSASKLLAVRPEEGQANNDWSSMLSEREIQVAREVASGASNREIALKLSITERTVKAHLSAIFEKLALRDRLQLSLRINGLSL